MIPVKSVRYPVGWLHFTVNFKLACIDHARPLPSVLLNPFKIVEGHASSSVGNRDDIAKLFPNLFGNDGRKSDEESSFLDDSSAWPPGCGKATILKALSGNLDKSLKVDVLMYSVLLLFFSKDDRKFPTMVTGWMSLFPRKHLMMMVSKRVEVGIVLDPNVDTYAKAISVKGQKNSFQIEHVLKLFLFIEAVIGLDICAVTMVGDEMRRGISGGQKGD
ncbi:hypothetical protein Patl1_24560 [Pistacia atlantica]|uniref:Uncharacterized protein n=1 Tax=Pistacia atlantica TaxID=434234 RepID=A0ACC0ZWM8_9ROSI|nr:hypothetical protein Patl1_24560 [Pistacia atlantica]